ncbi:hypothetical protein COV13_03650 [Candidatus Woesearchaeota archaeon CG10_big_fil_rev_8_21_14_0_10_32_9]|nr:MAG: hypothetical protein COV13_03650 [Candidatus Woesearchaeota archaeon CG10_big_fil_rev_8_21_14_0_10_32_9]
MEVGKKLYVTDRKVWRSWLVKNHTKEKEIWLVYYKKSSGKKRIPYNDAVEEALCFGWIDGILKGVDEQSFAQRFTPRRKKSVLSELNKERIRNMIKEKKMTDAGLTAVSHAFDKDKDEFTIPKDILNSLKKDKLIWENFQNFSKSYQRVRIMWIDTARSRPEIFEKRLLYFIKMTAKNKKYGMMQ